MARDKTKVTEYNKKFYAENRESERARQQQWIEENKDRRVAYMKDWRAENREHRNQSLLEWQRANPEAYKRNVLKRTLTYRCKKRGITVAQYYHRLTDQNGGCAVCEMTPEENGRLLAIDHDHETNEVRGLLCHGCNTTLGHMRDDPALIARLIDYLKRS